LGFRGEERDRRRRAERRSRAAEPSGDAAMVAARSADPPVWLGLEVMRRPAARSLWSTRP
jgi:hypothetical protein